jgi:hypothetical protein
MKNLLILLLDAAALVSAQSRTYPIINTITGGFSGNYNFNGSPATSVSRRTFPYAAAFDSSGNFYFSSGSLGGAIRCVNLSLDGRINTVAGIGVQDPLSIAGGAWDGSPGPVTPIGSVRSIAFDTAGDLLFADYLNQRIGKVASDGTVSTVAGTGVAGFSGDGGPAIQAQLSSPQAIAVDASNNIYISDQAGLRVRKFANGTISTIAGNGVAGYSGHGGPAVNAQVNGVTDLKAGADGTLYLADQSNNRVRAISPGGIISTIAGTGVIGNPTDGGVAASLPFDAPGYMALDGAGNLFVNEGNVIWKIGLDGIIHLFGGGQGLLPPPGPAKMVVTFSHGMAVDASGSLYSTSFLAGEASNSTRAASLRLSLEEYRNMEMEARHRRRNSSTSTKSQSIHPDGS